MIMEMKFGYQVQWGNDLSNAIKRLSAFVAKDTLRPAFNGINFSYTPEKGLRLCANDGETILVITIKQTNGTPVPFNKTINPSDIPKGLKGFAYNPETDKLVMVGSDNNPVEVPEIETKSKDGKLIKAQYPNYDVVFPEKTEKGFHYDNWFIAPKSFQDQMETFRRAKVGTHVRIKLTNTQLQITSQDLGLDIEMSATNKADVYVDGEKVNEGGNFAMYGFTFGINPANLCKCFVKDHHPQIYFKAFDRMFIMQNYHPLGSELIGIMPVA